MSEWTPELSSTGRDFRHLKSRLLFALVTKNARAMLNR
jgi:hypothetical protein